MVQVKICGITNIDDARAAAEAGADMLGFVFYPKSPRNISPERVRDIISALREEQYAVRFCGVFVDASSDSVRDMMQTAQLDLAQLHGQESPEMVQALKGHAYKSLQAREIETARALIAQYRDAVKGNVPAFIADAPPAQLPGGNGTLADWSIAREIAAQFPILLAGGLKAENVQAAIAQVQPWGVDVSSGVERAPGFKDHEQVREFIARAKNVETFR